jgi:hypothetical protein
MIIARSTYTQQADSIRLVPITEADRAWVLRLAWSWSMEEERRLLGSERGYRPLPGGGSMVTITSPRSGRDYQILSRRRAAGLEIGCSCDGFRRHRRCSHVAAVVWAYHPWAIGGLKRRGA